LELEGNEPGNSPFDNPHVRKGISGPVACRLEEPVFAVTRMRIMNVRIL
jgi:hypothetical protein